VTYPKEAAMNCHTPCPDPAQLRGLLDTSLPPAEQARLIGHLDSCEDCQHSLEEVAAGGSSWSDAVRHVDQDQPPADSAFWSGLRQVEGTLLTDIQVGGPAPTAEPVPLDFLSPPQKPGSLGRLGHFDIEEVIGRGGMGVVLRAHDACLERHVALKVLDPQMANNDMARKRFCREARAAAAVTHENVVAIHQVEVEESRDLPYLVMQLVTGMSLQERLDRSGPLELNEILRIGMQTASGLAAAHAQGLIHRDVKPANILLEHGQQQVKLTDFGLARAAEDVKLTQTGFVAGTPLYMSPEQAKGEPLDHRADLFSLGSVLYAMCTGRPPFDGSTPFVVLKSLTEELPRPIRDVNPSIPEWLVGIIDKLHAKVPADRFQSAAEVAEVLGRGLALVQTSPGNVVPCPEARAGRKPAGRALTLFWTLAVGVPLGLLVGLLLAEASGWTGLTAGLFRARADESAFPTRAVLQGNAGPVWSVAFAPDGATLAMGIDDGSIKIWDPATGSIKATLKAHNGSVWSVAFSPDGSLLASASDDGTAKLWDAATWKEKRSFDHEFGVRAVAFTPDGKTLVTGTRKGKVRLWDVATGKEPRTTEGHQFPVISVAVSPDGKTIASGSGDKTVRLWDAATGTARVTLEGHTGSVYSVAFSPDSRTVASGGWSGTVCLWDAGTGTKLATLRGHEQDVWAVAFSPDGKTLASAGEDHTIKLWDVASGKERRTLKGHTGTVYAVRFSPDGTLFASGGRDGTVRLFDTAALGLQ
jgi:Tol biopolymer transport system component